MAGTAATPEKVALAYTVDSYWRNRAEFVQGREAIIGFLTRKWQRAQRRRQLCEDRRPQLLEPLASLGSQVHFLLLPDCTATQATEFPQGLPEDGLYHPPYPPQYREYVAFFPAAWPSYCGLISPPVLS